MAQEQGLRHDQGKPRYDLIPARAEREYAKVLTKGALKYKDRNWEKGMPWSKVIGAAKRHQAAIERGEDYDFDKNCPECLAGTCVNHTGLLHSALLMTNAAFLTEYYSTHPELDDRRHEYLIQPKIGLDIDEVICDWSGGWCERHGYEQPTSWLFSYQNREHFAQLAESGETDAFLSGLKPKLSPKDIPFEPHCYITAREPALQKVTQDWLMKHGFPAAPLYTTGYGIGKVQAAKDAGLDWFVDDSFDNFVELNNGGVCCFLLDAPHNRRHDVGHKRIYSLKELVNR